MTTARVYQKPNPRNLKRTMPGFRRDGRWVRKWEPKHVKRTKQRMPDATLAELLGWVVALSPRRGEGKAWTDDEQAAVNELHMRAWRPVDLEQRRNVMTPTWLTRELVHPRYHFFLSMLFDAYRAGAAGILISYSELKAWLGMSRRTIIRWVKHLSDRRLLTVVSTCVEASEEGRRRDNAHNLYLVGPAIFDAVGDALRHGLENPYEDQNQVAMKDAARARKRARTYRAHQREIDQAIQQGQMRPGTEDVGEELAAGLKSPGSAVGRGPSSSPPVDVGGKAKRPKPAQTKPAQSRVNQGGDKTALQQDLRSAGSSTLPPQTPELHSSQTPPTSTGGDEDGPRPTAEPGDLSPAANSSPAIQHAWSQWADKLQRQPPPRVQEASTPTPAPPGRANGASKLRAKNPEPESFEDLAKLWRVEPATAVPKDQCPTCEGRGWGKSGLGWDPSRTCRDCRGLGILLQ